MIVPPGFTAIIDTREKLPYSLILADGTELPHEIATLKTGDYSLKGYEEFVSFERKSFTDLLGCIGKHRDRFERELVRLESKLYRGLVVEGSWRLIESCQLVSRLHPNAAIGSLLSWVSRGIPVLMLENRERANEYVCRLLLHAYKRLTNTGVHHDPADSLPSGNHPLGNPIDDDPFPQSL